MSLCTVTRNTAWTWLFTGISSCFPSAPPKITTSCAELSGASGAGGCGDSPWGLNGREKACGCPRLPGCWPSQGYVNNKPETRCVFLPCRRSFCGKHRPTQNVHQEDLGEESCVLCCEDLSQTSVENIQSPCCSQAVYHRKCIQVGLSQPAWHCSDTAQLPHSLLERPLGRGRLWAVKTKSVHPGSVRAHSNTYRLNQIRNIARMKGPAIGQGTAITLTS